MAFASAAHASVELPSECQSHIAGSSRLSDCRREAKDKRTRRCPPRKRAPVWHRLVTHGALLNRLEIADLPAFIFMNKNSAARCRKAHRHIRVNLYFKTAGPDTHACCFFPLYLVESMCIARSVDEAKVVYIHAAFDIVAQHLCLRQKKKYMGVPSQMRVYKNRGCTLAARPPTVISLVANPEGLWWPHSNAKRPGKEI
ncbi:hypothetical protein GQ54DRAFT_26213 [Martensiomyces pterosporus]|nr:hypothetical protein GQ54DRAFT_26213 [Martensiomyces pterosporus]